MLVDSADNDCVWLLFRKKSTSKNQFGFRIPNEKIHEESGNLAICASALRQIVASCRNHRIMLVLRFHGCNAVCAEQGYENGWYLRRNRLRHPAGPIDPLNFPNRNCIKKKIWLKEGIPGVFRMARYRGTGPTTSNQPTTPIKSLPGHIKRKSDIDSMNRIQALWNKRNC